MFLNQQAFLFLSISVQLHRRTNRIKALPSSAWRGLLSTTDKVWVMEVPAMPQQGSKGRILKKLWESRIPGSKHPAQRVSAQSLADRLSCGLQVP